VRVLILLLLAASAALATGCQESGFDERRETARPLKVQHVLGESKVPGQAERPATLTVDALDDTLALYVRPVRAAVPKLELPAYLREEGGGVELMNPITTADLPALEAADPDLIVGGLEGGEEFYLELSGVAPTVITEEGGGLWKLNVRLVGEALGRTNDAEALLTDYDARVARVRSGVEGRPSVAVVRNGENGPELPAADSFAATVLSDVGVRRARSVAGADLVLRANGSREDLWFGPGGILAGRAALEDLQRILHE